MLAPGTYGLWHLRSRNTIIRLYPEALPPAKRGMNFHGKKDDERWGVGNGTDGRHWQVLRVKYEITPPVRSYVGVEWSSKFS